MHNIKVIRNIEEMKEIEADKKRFSTLRLTTDAVNLNNDILNALLSIPEDEKELYESLLETLMCVRNLLEKLEIYETLQYCESYFNVSNFGGEEECQSNSSQEQELV